jgi:hypothetical protein
MAISSYDILTRPFDDDYMEYDYTESRYVPLVKGIMKDAYVNLIIDWGSEANAQSYLDLLSRVVYETILSFKDVKWRLHMLYYMSHSKKARLALRKIFSDSVWYNRRDGGFLMAYNSGANLNQGKLIEFGIDKALSPIAKQICKNTYLGTRVLPVDLNTNQTFTTLALLLAYLVAQGYITSDQSDVVTASEDLDDLPYHEDYDIITLDSGSYLFRDLTTIKDAIEDMKIYNTTTGTW